MNAALFSSKKMDYCTPQAFFDELNREFHFTLDAAATDKSAKCPAYFTPDTDGLKMPNSMTDALTDRRYESENGTLNIELGPYCGALLK